jgi:formylglycine-generating enzyme required for sulfatase activity
MKDYYKVLEIHLDATQEQIKQQYRFLVQAWHPDKFSAADGKVKAEERLKQINEAYAVLKDPAKREQYNRQREYFQRENTYQERDADNRWKREQEAREKEATEKQQQERSEAKRPDDDRQKHEQEAKRKEAGQRQQQEQSGAKRRENDTRTSLEPKPVDFSLKLMGAISIVLVLLLVGSISLIISFLSAQKATPLPSTITDTKHIATLQPTVTLFAKFTPTSIPNPAVITERGAEMVLISAATFIMGSNKGSSVERPVHQVSLSTFYMDRYEVTNILYKECVQVVVCQPPLYLNSATRPIYYGNTKFDNYPVIFVDWEMAKNYCEWRGARLPTEAEWEYAARGTDGRTYPWGENIDQSRANYYETDTSAVGSYEMGKSPFGLYDMAGNVWEWVSDWFQPDYYSRLEDNASNPQGPITGSQHVLRGGSWGDIVTDLRTTFRYGNSPDYMLGNFGFRCARDAQP